MVGDVQINILDSWATVSFYIIKDVKQVNFFPQLMPQGHIIYHSPGKTKQNKN